MKKVIFGSGLVTEKNLIRNFLLTCCAMLIFIGGYAQKISNGNGDWNNPNIWNPVGVPTAAENVTIRPGDNIRVNVAATCANMTINGTLRLDNNSLTVGGNWVNNGTFNSEQDNNNNTVTFIGAAATIGGTAITTFSGLRINTTGTVTLLSNAINIGVGQYAAGRITLQNGILDVGVGNSINLNAQANTTITSNGGNFRSYGPNGWTLNTALGYGSMLEINGTVTLDNVQPAPNAAPTNWANRGYRIVANTAGSATTGLHINGIMRVDGEQAQTWRIETNAPVWGPASTLYLNRQEQQFELGQNGDRSWIAMANGTIGATPGYPNNVVLVNMGQNHNVDGVGVGWRPGNIDLAINGTLQMGDGTVNGRISLDQVNSFKSGGIIVDNNSTLIGPRDGRTFINRGNFILRGATTGAFHDKGAVLNFAGNGTFGNPQIIRTSGSSVNLGKIEVSNNTYVRLESPVSIANSVALTAGKIGTSVANSLTLNNSSTDAINAGNANTYIDGPLSWAIGATTTNNYLFPVGSTEGGGAYLPLTVSPNTASGTVVTVGGVNYGSGGTHDATVNTLSQSEFWYISTSAPFTTGATVSVTHPNVAALPSNALAASATQSGVYTAIGGIRSGSTLSGAAIGTSSPLYLALVSAPLSAVKISSTNVNCNGTLGTLTAGGSGGTPPYSFALLGGAFTPVPLPNTTHTFTNVAGGEHQVVVQDALGDRDTTVMKVLGSLQINEGADSAITCNGTEDAVLSAENFQNPTPTYSWSTNPGGTPVIHTGPTYTTRTEGTYYVTSVLYANNFVRNGSFEQGNTEFTSDFDLYTGPSYGDTPDNGGRGWYSVSTAGNTQCIYFTTDNSPGGNSLSAQDGSAYFIGDGSNGASNAWRQTVNGLTPGTEYKFQYYYAAANPHGNRARLEASIAGNTLGTVTTNNPLGWTQVTYNWTATAATATITIRSVGGGIDGNDFFLDNIELLEPCSVQTSIQVTASCLLPVTLIDFSVAKKDEGALISWTTASEINSAYFIIEKSYDGQTFQAIGRVNAVGNSNVWQKYTFEDALLNSGITYYRLAQYDWDGTVSYSLIKTLAKGNTIGVQIVPNPNDGIFIVTLDNIAGREVRVNVLNALGQQVYTGEPSTDYVKHMDITHLASGVYYVQIITEGEVVVKKVIKE
jgi:hypothetical protein